MPRSRASTSGSPDNAASRHDGNAAAKAFPHLAGRGQIADGTTAKVIQRAKKSHPGYFPSLCRARLAAMTHPESYFPADYRQGRRNFIAACEKVRADSIARVHPAAKGPDGKPLFIDSVALGPRGARKALLLIAGTHGVEGYFGSGVQNGLLREGLTPPPGCRIVLVHALNPYGFAWNRRVNEDNVDLNRNFIDYASPPENPGYAELADAIAYEDADPLALALADARLDAYADQHGVAKLQEAISRGQYRFPKGLHYGGRAESWSHKMLRSILTEDLSGVERLVVIDCHTGLGETGAGEMIVEDPPGSPAYRRAQCHVGRQGCVQRDRRIRLRDPDRDV